MPYVIFRFGLFRSMFTTTHAIPLNLHITHSHRFSPPSSGYRMQDVRGQRFAASVHPKWTTRQASTQPPRQPATDGPPVVVDMMPLQVCSDPACSQQAQRGGDAETHAKRSRGDGGIEPRLQSAGGWGRRTCACIARRCSRVTSARCPSLCRFFTDSSRY